jgi:GTP-binding protein
MSKINWNKAEINASYGRFPQIPAKTRPEIAFSGRSNVGKSSLINKLLNRKSLARVSGKPGKTITINFFAVDEIFIVDLPGYGYAKTAKSERARFGELTERYLKSARVDLLVQLIDFRHPPTADDLLMLEFLTQSGIPFIIALTKADKLKKKQRDERRALLNELLIKEMPHKDIKIVEFSSETGEGAEELREVIQNAIS